MKSKVVFITVVVIFVFVVVYSTIGNVRKLGQKYNRPVPYNPQKINRRGEYQPFYGYTIVAMIDPSLIVHAERIERFLRTSSLALSYSPLPAATYHMTIYSIYQCGNRMIPAVERASGGVAVSKHFWLPNEVLQEQHDKAMCIIEKYLNEPLRIKYATLNILERNIKLLLDVDEDSLLKIRTARNELAKVYEHVDLSMEPINEKLHITFGYVYAAIDQPNVNEWNQLNKLVKAFSGAQLSIPSVYLFDSMTNYIPYGRKNVTEC